MVDPIRPEYVDRGLVTGPDVARPQPRWGQSGFGAELRRQLEEVSRMQAEAEAGIQKLLTGQSDSITEVLISTRKAEIAFSLLMEIRNKLVEAYNELKQLRV